VEQTEFRFYWLKSKMEELPCLSERSDDNAFVFTSLAYHQCSVSTMAGIMATENLFGQSGPTLDGLLFYHSEAHYFPGRTPLVGWLKPHMMATVLSVPVASMYLHTEEKSRRKFQKHHRKSQVNFQKFKLALRKYGFYT
jgi:snurportin-1